MPCILKQSVPGSPGIITFTHGEALWGVPKRSRRVKELLLDAKRRGSWIFGIHVQGDCSHLSAWPMPEWQSFVMWSEQNAPFIHNLPAQQFCPYTCINFMPGFLPARPEEAKEWDICVISRASSIKRIKDTLFLIRAVLDQKPDARIAMIVPDPRRQELGDKSYDKQRIDRNYFELPRKLFTANELKNITFISSSQEAFGNFPLADSLIAAVLGKSRFMMLNSHLEGVPRVIAEALLLGVPCIVSENLKSGLNSKLDENNSIRISDDANEGASQVVAALDRYEKFKPDRQRAAREFSESEYLKKFRSFLSGLIKADGHEVRGPWYFEDLHLRLACHGQKQNLQFFYNETLFLNWFERASLLKGERADEDFLAGPHPLNDEPSLWQKAKHYAGPTVHRLRMAIK